MKKVSLFLATMLVATAVFAQRGPGPGPGDGRRDGERRDDRRDGDRRGPDRRDRWDRNKDSYRRLADRYARSLRHDETMIGYTMLDDSGLGQDFDNVELWNDVKNVDEVRIAVVGDDARIDTLKIDFCANNDRRGHRRGTGVETFSINARLRANESTGWIDLRGRNRCISGFTLLGKGVRGSIDSVVILVGKSKPDFRPPPPSRREKIPVYRFNTGGDHFYTTDPGVRMGSGEGTPFYVLADRAPGSYPIFQCVQGGNNYFVSRELNCEGNRVIALLGFVFPESMESRPGMVEIFRYRAPRGQDHLVTVGHEEGRRAGYILEGPLGKAFSSDR